MKNIIIILFALFLVGCQPCPECPEREKQERPELSQSKIVYNSVTLSIDYKGAELASLYQNGSFCTFLANTDTNLTILFLEPETEYMYVLNVYGECGKASDTLKIMTPRNPKPKDFAQFAGEKVGANSVFLTWENSDETIDYFAIMRNDEQTAVTTENKYLDNDLEPGEYVYRIIAVGDGQTASPDTTITIEQIAEVPNVPENIQVDADFREIKVTWDVVSNAINYTVKIDSTSTNILEPEILIDSLEIDSGYTVEVWASNEYGKGESVTVEAKTRGAFIASWDANTEENIAGYRLYMEWGENSSLLLYDGPETEHEFVVEYDPCVFCKAYKNNGLISISSVVVCVEKE